jgi:C-terminal processing protease CtpA/Prc
MSVSSARFVRANGDTTDHRGVVPDEVVTEREADLPIPMEELRNN